MKIKTYGVGHITTYKLKIGKYVTMLDFNGDNMMKEDVEDLDLIFLSHEHLDHCEKLIDYDLITNLKSSVRIFATETTKKLISYSLAKRMNSDKFRKKYNDKKYNQITKLIDDIEIVRFKKKVSLDEENSFTFYRSGHTFGSSMIYFNTKEFTLLYTGDMDYVENDNNRQYDFPYNMRVDYIIADGTNLFDKDYKGVRISSVRKKLSQKKPGDIVYYYARAEKAVLYALTLASKLDNCIFIYTDQMKWYVKILLEQEYNIFKTNKVFMERDVDNLSKSLYESNIVVKFTDNQKNYYIDTCLSLHITKYEFSKFIKEHLSNTPKKIYIGHYDMEDAEQGNIQIDNACILKVGENDE